MGRFGKSSKSIKENNLDIKDTKKEENIFFRYFVRERYKDLIILSEIINNTNIRYMSLISPLNHFTTPWQKYIVYTVKDKKLVKNIEIIDPNTLERYTDDSMISIARKASLIFFFNPILLFCKLSFNVIQMGFDFAKVTIDSTIQMAKDIRDGDIIKICETYLLSRIDLFRYLGEDIVYIVRAPFYALAMQFASVYGIFAPRNGRKVLAKIEKNWNFNQSIKKDFRQYYKNISRPFYEVLFDIFLERKQGVVFYLAPCFQPLGSLKDRHIIDYREC